MIDANLRSLSHPKLVEEDVVLVWLASEALALDEDALIDPRRGG